MAKTIAGRQEKLDKIRRHFGTVKAFARHLDVNRSSVYCAVQRRPGYLRLLERVEEAIYLAWKAQRSPTPPL